MADNCLLPLDTTVVGVMLEHVIGVIVTKLMDYEPVDVMFLKDSQDCTSEGIWRIAGVRSVAELLEPSCPRLSVVTRLFALA